MSDERSFFALLRKRLLAEPSGALSDERSFFALLRKRLLAEPSGAMSEYLVREKK